MRLKIHINTSFLLFFAFAGFSQNIETEKILKTFHSISSHDLLNIAEELSSDYFSF